MRIIAGRAGGRRLAAPPGRSVRPTSDRMREGLFAALAADGPALAGCRFLDLYAGSAAVGIEAWSRGADNVLAVEHDRRNARVARRNAESVGAGDAVVVRVATVERVASSRPSGAPYDIMFADPPYDMTDGDLAEVLTSLVGHGWLRPGAVLVVERASRGLPFAWPPWATATKSREYGEGTLWYARVNDQHDER